MVAPSKVLALLFLGATASTDVPQSLDELVPIVEHDECLADAGTEACSISLRQLRGLRSSSSLADRYNASSKEGFCCQTGTSKSDMCGTCTAASEARCDSAETCADCGGEWCGPVCVMGFRDPDDVCGSAWPSAMARSNEYCGGSKYLCSQHCHGIWCDQHPPAPKLTVAHQEQWKMSGPGFCCASSSDGADTCGTCNELANHADYGSCASSQKCARCGGTWCQSTCVLAARDPEKPCSTAFDTAIAKAGDYCSESKRHCSVCKGSWCLEPRESELSHGP